MTVTVKELREALRALASEAAIAVCEPRAFHENEEGRQQRLGHAVSAARLLADRADPGVANAEFEYRVVVGNDVWSVDDLPGGLAVGEHARRAYPAAATRIESRHVLRDEWTPVPMTEHDRSEA